MFIILGGLLLTFIIFISTFFKFISLIYFLSVFILLSLRGNRGAWRWALMCLHENHFKLLILALSTLCHCQLLFVVFFSSWKAASSCGLRLSWTCASPPTTLLLLFLAASHVACSLCFSLRVALLLLNFFPRHFLKLAFSVRRAGFTHTLAHPHTHLDWAACLAVSLAMV